MKNLEFLKPIFTLGMLVILAFILIVNLLIFKYIPSGTGAFWFVTIEELAVVLGYIISRNLKDPDKVVWGFAKKWWE